MDDFFALVLVAWFTIATVITAQFAWIDYREFGAVVKQCEKQGFIQDKTIRVSCSVEK